MWIWVYAGGLTVLTAVCQPQMTHPVDCEVLTQLFLNVITEVVCVSTANRGRLTAPKCYSSISTAEY